MIVEIINDIFNKVTENSDFSKCHEIRFLKTGYSYYCYGLRAFIYKPHKEGNTGFIEIEKSNIEKYDMSAFNIKDTKAATKIYIDESIDIERLYDLFSYLDKYCENLVPTEFDCCSKYKECSKLIKCVNSIEEESSPLGLQCTYRKKLKNGIIYNFGAN